MRSPTNAHSYGIPAILALMAIAAILAFTTVMTVSAQSDDRDWKMPVTGLTAVAGDDPGEMIISWDAHTQTTKTFLNYRVAWTPDGERFKSADRTNWNVYTTSNQHTVTGLDAGATYQVKVRTRYEGRQGSRWTDVVTGQSAVTLNTPATGQPTIAGTVETGETLTAATSSISDDNGLANAAFAYQWIHTATDSEAYIPAATGSSYLLSSDDLGHAIKVRVTFTDDDGYTERLTSSATALVVMPANVAATGQPTITGTAEVGETLTAATSAISDSNGITNAVFSHQWVRSANGSDNDITDATGSTYVITNADIDKAIKVQVNFTDDEGYSETLTSAATTSVPVPAPVIVPPEEHQIARAAGDDDEPVVLDDWSLKPSGLGVGDQFRLIFLSSTKRNATSSNIGTYNTWIQGRAAAGHDDIQAYSHGFTAVGCTEDTDARDNTSTTYTVIERGAPIYWLDGDLVAVEYADFYDGSWDDEANPKDESGNNGPDTSVSDNYPITGCNHNGTENVVSGNSLALGSAPIRVAVPDVSNPGTGPLSSSSNLAAPTAKRPMYGLSAVFIVTETSTDATLSGLDLVGTADGESITLNPDFDTGTFTYAAAVAHGIDEVTLTATKNESNATVVITGDDDTRTQSEANLDLIVGPNTLTVAVTATDTSTTQTYTVTVIRADFQTDVHATWGLIPTDFGIGDRFRLIFFSSTNRDALPTSIDDYNTWIQDLAAAGHADIQAYSSGFRVVGCTEDDDARDNTFTQYNNANKGVPIYWLNGDKVANQYEDFYDGVWNNEGGLKKETGMPGPEPGFGFNWPWTGCDKDGTENISGGTSHALGDPDSSDVRTGKLNSFAGNETPLWNGSYTDDASDSRHMYGLSKVFNVVEGPDAKLNDLVLENTALGESITLSPAFETDTFAYGTTVGNSVNAVTLTATKNDSLATVAITNNDDPSTPNTAEFGLIVGANTLTVTVTAVDATTETYTISVIRAEPPTDVHVAWGLIPTGLGIGDQFRLIFFSSTNRDALPTSIDDYNTWIQDLAAAGHDDIQAYSNGFRVVGCTEDDDARDNTSTQYNNADKGVPIYWLNGDKVANQYEDFYDGVWNNEGGLKKETGMPGPEPGFGFNWPWTGCDKDGTENISGGTSHALGDPDSSDVRTGKLNSFAGNETPLWNGSYTDDASDSRHMYGLSKVFNVMDFPDATLSTLSIKDTPGSEIVHLSPTFAADTFTYTTSVPNEINAVTLTVTKSESYDTVVITNDDDTSTPDTAEFSLIVGVNTLTVTVTAQGGTAKAYTVTLTRAPQTAPDAPTGLMATANGTSDINLEWTEPAYDGANAISGYKIQHSPAGNSPWTNLTGNTGNADTEYSDTGLDPRTTRHYRVFAINSIGTGPKSNIANATTDASPTPAQVRGVNVAPSNGALSVRWTAVSDATGYKVRWKSGSENYNAGREASITSGSTNNYTISGLNNGTQYLVTVIATKTGANDGPPSLETSGTPSPIPPSVTFGPGSFTASENGATATVTVELSVPAADDVTIPLRVQHRNGTTSADYSGVPRRLIFEDGNTIRSFTVTAVDDLENDDGEKIKIEFYDLPAGFPAGARSSITVKLKDNDGGNSLPLFDPANELRDLVENTPANQNVGLPITATDADGDSLSYTFSGPDMDRFTFVPATAQLRTKSGQTYDYETHELFVVRVTADDGNGGTKTATVVISVRDVDEPPQEPTGLTLVQAYPTSMALSWTPPDNTGRPAITGYDLQYKKSNETTWTAGLQGITETSDSITDLDPSTSYHVQVRANNDDGNGTWSSTLAHSTPSVSPGISITKTNLTVTEGNQTGVTYLIVLGSEPTADVTVHFSGYESSTVAPHRPATVFNTGNWNAPREVRLRTIEDADTTDETVTITHAVTSRDADYNGIAVPNLTVTIIDNDTPQVTGVWTQPRNRQLIVNWNATDKATGYKVQWKAPGDNYNTYGRLATITSGSTTTYAIPNLTNGTEYTVLVTATWTDHSDGPRSDEATGTPTATP